MVRVALPQQPPFPVPLLFSPLRLVSFLSFFFFRPLRSLPFSARFPSPSSPPVRDFPPRRARPLAGNGRNIEGSHIRMNTLKRGNKKQRRRRVGRAGVARGTGGNGEPRINNALRGHAKINMRTKEPAERNEAIAPTRATPLENSTPRNGVRIGTLRMYLLRVVSGNPLAPRVSAGTRRVRRLNFGSVFRPVFL